MVLGRTDSLDGPPGWTGAVRGAADATLEDPDPDDGPAMEKDPKEQQRPLPESPPSPLPVESVRRRMAAVAAADEAAAAAAAGPAAVSDSFLFCIFSLDLMLSNL